MQLRSFCLWALLAGLGACDLAGRPEIGLTSDEQALLAGFERSPRSNSVFEAELPQARMEGSVFKCKLRLKAKRSVLTRADWVSATFFFESTTAVYRVDRIGTAPPASMPPLRRSDAGLLGPGSPPLRLTLEENPPRDQLFFYPVKGRGPRGTTLPPGSYKVSAYLNVPYFLPETVSEYPKRASWVVQSVQKLILAD